eukprot:scaffold82195_cov28-Tisochrysis_lutea.AAC.2
MSSRVAAHCHLLFRFVDILSGLPSSARPEASCASPRSAMCLDDLLGCVLPRSHAHPLRRRYASAAVMFADLLAD